MNTNQVSADPTEITRKVGARLRGEIGQQISYVTQARAAELMGVSPSTVSRLIAEDLDRFCQFMAALGLQVAPLDSIVLSAEELNAMQLMAYKYLQTRVESGARR